MPGVAVVTDTTQYLPAEAIARHDIHLVSLYVSWNGRIDREADLADYDAFYDYLRSGGELPSTSQPSVGDFLAVYEPLLEAGRDIVSIHLSAGISGTFTAAEQARDQLVERGIDPARIVVLDSATACAGLGMLAMAAASAARAGGSAAEAAEAARACRRDLKVWFAVDTLEFLRRGGRVGGAAAWLGSTLKIKPILTVESEITPIERVRTSRRAFERMVDLLRSLGDEGRDAWMVQHIQAPEEAAELARRGRELIGCEPLVISEIGPVIGTHVGPGLLGAGGLPKRFL
jgi:DegV family protein with EDD domain